MLYATTRNNAAVYPARQALREERAPDGGFYVPARIPYYDRDTLLELMQQPPSVIMARILNDYFGAELGKVDVEFAVGRRFFGVTDISHRIFIGELWRNSDWSFDALCRRLTQRISLEFGMTEPGTWMRIVCRVGLIFAMVARLYRTGKLSWFEEADIAVMTGDFEGPYAATLARRMGLPMGQIVCCCNENSGIWDLMNRGQMKLNAKLQRTITPKCDTAAPAALELFLRDRLEWDDVAEFLNIQARGGTYYLSAEEQRHFRAGMAVSVVGDSRVKLAMPNLYRTNGYILCPYSALVYTGLMDYRSQPGPRRAALVLADYDPRDSRETVIRALTISDRELDEWRLGV